MTTQCWIYIKKNRLGESILIYIYIKKMQILLTADRQQDLKYPKYVLLGIRLNPETFERFLLLKTQYFARAKTQYQNTQIQNNKSKIFKHPKQVQFVNRFTRLNRLFLSSKIIFNKIINLKILKLTGMRNSSNNMHQESQLLFKKKEANIRFRYRTYSEIPIS